MPYEYHKDGCNENMFFFFTYKYIYIYMCVYTYNVFTLEALELWHHVQLYIYSEI